MKVTSCKLGWVVGMMALLLAGGAVAAKPAAKPNIAPSSCGGVVVPPSGNAFCSFESDGSGVVIGHNSCNVEGACLLLGNGVRIGNDSCNGETACAELGGDGGSSVIGNSACDGDFACWGAGYQGRSVIGNNSCNGPATDRFGGEPLGVCTGVGFLGGSGQIGNSSCNDGAAACLFVASGPSGSFVVGNISCSGREACTFGGQNGGIGVIGNNSCNAERSCFDNAQEAGSISRIGNNSCNELSSCKFAGDFGAKSVIGNKSCNSVYACEFAGTDAESFEPMSSAIGNHSCNGAADLSDPDNPVGICDSNVGTIGNNKNNTP
jgi:hypothetical protein